MSKLAHLAAKRPQSFGAQYYYGTCLVVAMNNDGTLTNASLAMATLNRAAQVRPRDARVTIKWAKCSDGKASCQRRAVLTEGGSPDPDYPEPLYKLGQAYAHLGKQEDAEKMFDRHRVVMSRQEANLDRRSSEIQSFIVSMKGVDEPKSNPEATRHN